MTRTLLRGGRVFDGTGAPPAEADLLVEDGRILEVGPGLDGDEAVDVAGRHLLPGLFDCHTHVTLSNVNLLGLLQAPFSYRFFQTVQNLAATLRVGITTVRDAPGADAGVKQAVADGPEAMRRKVRELVRAGADVIKVATSGGVLSPTDDPRHAHFRDDELTALVAEAAAVVKDGRLVAGHV
jgi:imidazolonepropionase-like amidohydrolase